MGEGSLGLHAPRFQRLLFSSRIDTLCTTFIQGMPLRTSRTVPVLSCIDYTVLYYFVLRTEQITPAQYYNRFKCNISIALLCTYAKRSRGVIHVAGAWSILSFVCTTVGRVCRKKVVLFL